MREILFKAKRKIDNHWIEGYYYYKDWTNQHCMMMQKDSHFKHYEIDRSTLCQYTGINDKKGIKIYEGDIVQKGFIYPGSRGKEVVEYCDLEGMFVLGTDPIQFYVQGSKYGKNDKRYIVKLEVLGNKHG